MNFEQIYEDSKERELIKFAENKQYEELKESVINDAKECITVPHERMSKVFRIFESEVADKDWEELRETIIDCENLERKIFHQGFEYALKEDQGQILESYARIATFDNKIHLTESYNSVEQWNNTKRRKELDIERNSKNGLKLFETLNDENLKEELREMFQNIREIKGFEVRENPEDNNKEQKTDITEPPLEPIKSDPEIVGKFNEKYAPLKAVLSSSDDLNDLTDVSEGEVYLIKEKKKITNKSQNPEERILFTKVANIFKKLSADKEKDLTQESTPAIEANPLESLSISELKGLKPDSEKLKIPAKQKYEFSVEKIAQKLQTDQAEAIATAKTEFINNNTGMNPKKLGKKLANEENFAKDQTKRLLDFESYDIRKVILDNIIKDKEADTETRQKAISELATLNKKTTSFQRVKAKVMNFLKKKAPTLMKIISFAGAAFGIATKFGTIVAIFAPLGPLAPIVGLVVATALFFIQKAIFNLAGKVTDKIVGEFFKKFVTEKSAQKGPIGFICKKLASGRAEAVTKIIVRILTTMLIAQPTASMLTGLVQKASGPMIAGLGAIGVTAETASRIIPDGIEGKLDTINKWAEGKAPPPIEKVEDPNNPDAGLKPNPSIADEDARIAQELQDTPPAGAPGAEDLPADPGAIQTQEVIKTPGQPTQYSAKWITDNNPNQAANGKLPGDGIWRADQAHGGGGWRFTEVEGKPGYFTAQRVSEPVFQKMEATGLIDSSGKAISSTDGISNSAESAVNTDTSISPEAKEDVINTLKSSHEESAQQLSQRLQAEQGIPKTKADEIAQRYLNAVHGEEAYQLQGLDKAVEQAQLEALKTSNPNLDTLLARNRQLGISDEETIKQLTTNNPSAQEAIRKAEETVRQSATRNATDVGNMYSNNFNLQPPATGFTQIIDKNGLPTAYFKGPDGVVVTQYGQPLSIRGEDIPNDLRAELGMNGRDEIATRNAARFFQQGKRLDQTTGKWK